MDSRHPKPRLLYVVTEDWFFVTHFLPMARAARNAGFDVVVVTRVANNATEIESEGFRLVDLSTHRSSFGLFALVSTVFRLRSVFVRESPTIVHAIALKSIVVGGGATLLRPRTAGVFSLTGLGFLWSGDRLALRMARRGVRLFLRLLAFRNPTIFTFENADDAAEFPTLPRKVIIGGWGLDPTESSPRQNSGAVASLRVIYLGRMLKAKGIESAVEALQIARKSVDIHLDLWGMPDLENLTSLTEAQLTELSTRDGVKWHGRAAEAFSTWQRGDVAILLSEREGMPRSLIEAAAAGLPLVSYDVPGCRSIVRHGVNGFLIPPGDLNGVADALIKLASNPDLRKRMGSAARADFEERFSTDSVVPKITALYLDLVRSPNIG